MRSIFTSLILLSCLLVHNKANAYRQGITISVKDESLDKVFSLLQKQTKFVFVYSGKQLAGTKKVSVDVVNEKFEKVMEIVMAGQPLRYEIDKEYVIIKIKTPGVAFAAGLPGELTGKVVNEKGEPMAGVTITVKNSKITTSTGADGAFVLKGLDPKDELVISNVGYKDQTIKVGESDTIMVKMTLVVRTYEEVIVKGSTGYQVIDKKHPGSFDVVDNQLLNRRVGPDILSRIEDVTPGVLFDRTAGARDPLLIRGRNSIFSNVAPIIVLDNFPYDGEINNINPNDIESITILKDAAAASIWGARAGNGVIVITTKRGKTSKPQVSINSNYTIQGKTDLSSLPIISSNDYIDVEMFLFNKGYYNADLNIKRNPPPITPVVEILNRKRGGLLTEEAAAELINKFRTIDARSDISNFLYRNAILLQNSVNISGNTNALNYYLSAGWDKNLNEFVGNQTNRISLRTINTFKVTEKIISEIGINFTQSSLNGNGSNGYFGITAGGTKRIYPYADLIDENGIALPLVKDYREVFSDTAGGGRLLDWKYRPIQDHKYSDIISKARDILVVAGIKYRIFSFLTAEVKYQYENTYSSSNTNNSIESYFTRNLINRYYQPGTNTFAIPKGDIISLGSSDLTSHQGRAQVTFNKEFGLKHEFNAFAGWEIKDVKTISSNTRIYGYDSESGFINTAIDYVTRFPQYNNSTSTLVIPSISNYNESVDRFISLYSNLLYSFKSKYSLSASLRNDAANLFGVSTNKKGVPLWSIGAAWVLSDENFFKASWVSSLKIRGTYGVAGNFSRLASALTTISMFNNEFGVPSADIVNPPNEKLRWEQNRQLNLGLDFSILKSRISGTFEFYRKKNKDLMAQAPIDPTLGVDPYSNAFFGNVASTKVKGFDINIHSKNFIGKFSWTTNLLFSKSKSLITEYLLPPPSNSSAYVSVGINPIVGKPVYSLHSYQWGGLDPNNGDPRGYLGKQLTKSYSSIINSTKIDSLVYHGAVQPVSSGAIRNTFSIKSLSISFNIVGRFGYYIRRSSINYASLFSTWTGSSDFAKRWQKQGDEEITNIPAMIYPLVGNRDNFFQNSEINVLKADHIRFDDISVNYALNSSTKLRLPFKTITFYLYINRLNWLLWRANDLNFDPNIGVGARPGKSFSFGCNLIF